ncbi:hypothetical protein P280DRAFT_503820 [Massarina eburnea CBS 473.64]|uniref:Uncharacterized protein n=1 Tax=Massarina eburnea CBS 473.64 TaxID=1395130 RepID=A0A6A6SCZ6_9PLEO|nr:hypothetical protein P280DRAFT_503820 [Massarina eburnea CBS 473.64]
MAPFSRLNSETQDQINAFVTQIAAKFAVAEDQLFTIIPEDIRPRKENNGYIAGEAEPENDARNWGLKFITLLTTIVRHLDGDLNKFQSDLRDIVWERNEADHPWCTLENIRKLKKGYEGGVEDDGAIDDEGAVEEDFEYLAGEKHDRSPEKKQKRTRLRRNSFGWARPEKKPRIGLDRPKKSKVIVAGCVPSTRAFRSSADSCHSGEEMADPNTATNSLALLRTEIVLAEMKAQQARRKLERLYGQHRA